MPGVWVGHLIAKTCTCDQKTDDRRRRLPCTIADRHFVFAGQHAHGRRPRMWVKERLLARTGVDAMELDAIFLPGAPEPLYKGWMVVDIEAVPAVFILQQQRKFLFDCV